MSGSSISPDAFNPLHDGTSAGYLTSDVRELLTELAIWSVNNAEMVEDLEALGRRLDGLISRHPEAEEAARFLKSKVTEWRAAHGLLATLVRTHTITYEDLMATAEQERRQAATRD